MSLFFILTPCALLAAIIERPRRVRAYRHQPHEFE